MTETEVERLVVRLIGDSTQFSAMLDRAVKEAMTAARRVERETVRSEAYINRVKANSQKQQYSEGARARLERERLENSGAQRAIDYQARLQANSMKQQFAAGERARRERESAEAKAITRQTAAANKAAKDAANYQARMQANSLRQQYAQGERERRQREAADARALVQQEAYKARMQANSLRQQYSQGQRDRREREAADARSEALKARMQANSLKQQYAQGERARRERESAEARAVARQEAYTARMQANSLRQQYTQGARARAEREAAEAKSIAQQEAYKIRMQANSLRQQYAQGERARREREAADAKVIQNAANYQARMQANSLKRQYAAGEEARRVRERAVTDAAAKAQMAHNAQMAKGAALVQASLTPLQRHSQAMAQATYAYRNGGMTAAQYNQVLKQQNEILAQSRANVADYTSELRNAGLVIAAFGSAALAAFGGLVLSSVKAAGKFTELRISFETMLGSVSEAKGILDRLVDFSIKTPFTMHEVEAAARTMVTFGERGDQLMDTLGFLGNAASATGTDFALVALVFNQIRGVGHLLMQDFRQLAIRGILSMQDLANHFGVTTAKAQEMMTAGEIGFESVREILRNLSSEGGRFEDMMSKLAVEQRGLWFNLIDTIDLVKREFGQALEPTVNSMIKSALEMAQSFRTADPAFRTLVGTVVILAASLAALVVVMGTAVFMGGQLAITGKALVAVYSALNAAGTTATIGSLALKASLATLAIAGIAAVSYALYQSMPAIKEYNKSLEDSKKVSDELTKSEMARRALTIQDIALRDGNDQKAAVAEALAAAKSEVEGIKFQIGIAKQALDQMKKEASPELGLDKKIGLLEWLSGKFGLTNSKGIADQEAQVEGLNTKLGEASKHLQDIRILHGKAFDPALISKVDEKANEYVASLKLEAMTYGLATREAKIFELSQQGVAKSIINQLLLWDMKLTKMEKDTEAQKEAKKAAEELRKEQERTKQENDKLVEEFMTPVEKFKARMDELQTRLEKGTPVDTVIRAIKEAQKELAEADLEATVRFHVEGNEAVRAGSAELRKLQGEMMKRKLMSERLMEADKFAQNKPINQDKMIAKVETVNPKDTALLNRIAAATEAANNKPVLMVQPLGLGTV